MTEPLRPWRETEPASPAQAWVKRAAEVPPRSMDVARGWDEVLERATQPRRPAWVAPGFVLAVAVGVAIGFFGMKRPPVVRASTGTQWEQRADGTAQLQVGRLQTSRAIDLTLETPQVSMLARHARFAAEVTAEGTRLTLFEGEAVVRSGGAEARVLKAGDEALWPALPRIPTALASASVPAPELCAEGDPTRRAACLAGAASGEGLQAEIALFELGRLQAQAGDAEGAVRRWRESLTRFPDGVFGPEARLAALVTLTQQQRFAEALSVARDFELSCAGDPRKEDVQRLRAQLEWLGRAR